MSDDIRRNVNVQDLPEVQLLGAELVAAAGRLAQRRRRQRRQALLAGATAALIAVATVVVAVVGAGPLGGPALAITRHEDAFVIEFVDASEAPEVMNQQLQEAGIDAEVVTLPAMPQLVGSFLWAETLGSVVTPLEDTVIVPADAHDVTIYVGRDAGPGETPAPIGGPAFAPSGALHCSGIELLPPPEAQALLQDLGYRVLWQPPTGGTSTETPPGDWVITGAGTDPTGHALLAVTPPDRITAGEGVPPQDCS